MNSGALLAVVEALVGIVEARVAAARAGGVVGRRALRDEREPAAADVVMLEQLLERRLPSASLGAQCSPSTSSRSKPVRACRRWRSIAIPMPAATARSKSTSHWSSSGTNRSAPSGWMRRRSGRPTGRARRRAAGDDRAADRLERLLAAVVADHHEAVGENCAVGACDHDVCLVRRVGGKDDERGRQGDVVLGRGRGRGVGEVEGHVAGDQLALPAPRRRPCRARLAAACTAAAVPSASQTACQYVAMARGLRREPSGVCVGMTRISSVRRAFVARSAGVDRLVVVDDVAGAAGAVRRDQVAPGGALVGLDAARAPDPLPVPLRVLQLGRPTASARRCRSSSRRGRCAPRADAGALAVRGAEPRLDPHREAARTAASSLRSRHCGADR